MDLDNVKFSVPLWPGLSPEEINKDLLPFLNECKHVVSDLYFTCRIDPFNMDAMGGVIVSDEINAVLDNALKISEITGIPISATFNNTKIDPAYPNYKTLVENFAPLYEAGVRNITIPHTSWLGFGLKKEFPELFVKNTIINRVNTASEVAVLFEQGFDYVNLDRKMMRDEDGLKEITKAKEKMQDKLGRKLYISLLWNEMCEGNCPVQNEHFLYNFTRTEDKPAYFDSKMYDVSPCVQKDASSPEYILRAASIPSYYSHISHLNKYVDVFKMHGRENKEVFYNTMGIIRQFVRRELINDPYRAVLSKAPDKLRKQFLNVIKNCKFDCWKCNLCEVVADKIK